jgi:serine protease Do
MREFFILILLLVSFPPASLRAESPSAVAPAIEDEKILVKLEAEGRRLHQAGKTVRGAELLRQLNAAPLTCASAFLPDHSEASTRPADLYNSARPGVLILAGLYKCEKCHQLHPRPAGGVVLSASGVAVTNYHVVDVSDNVTLVAMTSDGQVVPVHAILAANKQTDIVVLQLDGTGFTPLTIAAAAPVGSEVFALTHPDERFFCLTRGVVSRYSMLSHGDKEKAVRVMEITADFAKGSSGCPILNDHGEVVGMVSSTSAVYYDEDKGRQRDLQMVFKECIPSEQILQIVAGINKAAANPQP